jgi:ActR/RegA family two-component response regulator
LFGHEKDDFIMTRQKRIFLIENKPIKIGTLRRVLEDKGYLIEVIDNYEEAKKKLNCKWAHLAIVDIRLVDDSNPDDNSGINLITKGADRAIKKVILTAYPTFEVAREVLVKYPGKIPPAVDFLYKLDPIDDMVEKIENAVSNLEINWGLETEFEDDLISYASMAAWFLNNPPSQPNGVCICQNIEETAEELEDLMASLFRNAKRISISKLYMGSRRSFVGLVTEYNDAGKGPLVVIKCGWRERISRIKENYDTYISKYLTKQYSQLKNYRETLHFSAIVYSVAGSSENILEDFNEFYYHEETDRIKAAIGSFFNSVSEWRDVSPIKKSTIRLDQEYRNNLSLGSIDGEAKKRIGEKITLLANNKKLKIETRTDRGSLEFIWNEELILKHDNLISWIYDTPSKVPAGLLYPYQTSITYGDARGANLIVDDDARTWLIDFSCTEYGYHLRDAAELETSIAIDLAPNVSLADYYLFTKILFQVNRWEEYQHAFDNININQINHVLLKPLLSIHEIRKWASKYNKDNGDIRRYYLALFFESAFKLSKPFLYSSSTSLSALRYAYSALRISQIIKVLSDQ